MKKKRGSEQAAALRAVSDFLGGTSCGHGGAIPHEGSGCAIDRKEGFDAWKLALSKQVTAALVEATQEAT